MKIIITNEQKILLAIGSELNTTTSISKKIDATYAWTSVQINGLLSEDIIEIDESHHLNNNRIKPLKLTELGVQIRDRLISLELLANGR